MSAVSFSGIASGIDSTSLIKQLVAIEKQPAQLLTNQQSDLASKKGIVDDLTAQVAGLGDLVRGMSLASDLQFRTGTSSDAHVSIAVSGTAATASHDVRVEQLARAQVTASRTFTTDTAGILGDGSVVIQGGTSPQQTITYSATDKLSDIAAKINDAHAGVSASVLFDGTTYRLLTTATGTGSANAPTFTESGDGLGLSDPANIKIKPLDAKVSVDGIEVTRPTNVLDDVLTGVTITALSPQTITDPDTTVTVANDTTAISDKLSSFMRSFNTIVSTIHGQLDYTGTTAGTSTLFGDSTLRQLQGAMSAMATTSFGGKTLADLGLTIDKTGQMSLDSTKLTSALSANPDAMASLFVGAGLTAAAKSMTDGYTEPGDGILTMQSKGYTDQTSELQKQIDEVNDRANQLQTRLQLQFSDLEAIMSKLNGETSYITKLLA